jgi:fructokinase
VTTERLYGGIEAGGTKFVCAVADDSDQFIAETTIPTTTPAETFKNVIGFFQPHVTFGRLKTIGLGAFGPLDLDPASATYGHIQTTTKAGWSHVDITGSLERGMGVKVPVETDVNAAAIGEYTFGASKGIDPSLYITIGTGIGGGYLLNGRPLHGLVNTEMGHIRIPHDLERDPFAGVCPFHGDCFEGLACGPAIRRRFDEAGEDLPEDDPFWELEADYIAAALMNYIVVLSPKKIILGGGVMSRRFLFPLIRRKVQQILNGYVESRSLLTDIDDYIVPPKMGSRSGVRGALVLAKNADSRDA